MRTNSRQPDAPLDALDRAWAATCPAEPNVSWDVFWTDVAAEGDAATRRAATGKHWNGHRKALAGLTLSFSTLAAAAVLFVAFLPARVKVNRRIQIAHIPVAIPVESAATPDDDASSQDVSIEPGQVVVLRLDKNGRLSTEGTGWEPSLAIGDSAYGYGTSDDSFEFIGYLEALGLDSLAVSGETSKAAPSSTP